MEEDQELERKTSGLKTSMAEDERKTALEMAQAVGTDRHLEFCGYTETHPSESKINLCIQTRGTLPAVESIRRGLKELRNICQPMLDRFEASIKDYKNQRVSRNEFTF
uniref:DNA-directed RNA polymerase RBP11-like dimerisation domain-containing protein n=1 Tax=Saimiri boliviensis boliviensis TaxID=39432 RepID=A0A2K6SWU5_SAIBB